MYCTWCLSAVPVPTTACLICMGVYSPVSRPQLAHATRAAPRAWAVFTALFVFAARNISSMATSVGWYLPMTRLISSWMRLRRRAMSMPLSVWMQPYARARHCMPRVSTMPQPVFARPGSMPRMTMCPPLERAPLALENRTFVL